MHIPFFKNKAKSKKHIIPEKRLDYYCEFCEKTSDYYLKTVNLVKETLLKRCPKCEAVMTEEKFIYKKKKLVVEDEWSIAGSREIDEDDEFNIKDQDETLTPRKKPKPKYTCKQCSEVFTSPVELRWHNEKMHKLKKRGPKPKKPEVKTADYVEPKEELLEALVEEPPDTDDPYNLKSEFQRVEEQDIPLYEDEPEENLSEQ